MQAADINTCPAAQPEVTRPDSDLQIFAIILVFAFPEIATWLPRLIN